MLLSSKLGQFYATAQGWKKRLLRILLLRLLADPDIQYDVRGKKLIAPASHGLPSYIAEFPFYDELVIRLSKYIREKEKNLIMVDVGANIGDTIVAANNSKTDLFLAVEPNRRFVEYLRRNCRNVQNMTLVEVFLTSEESGQQGFFIDEFDGTAQISIGGNEKIVTKTLDSLIDENLDFRKLNFLKVDTDGNDFEVIKGGRSSISAALPTVLFECDVFNNENYLYDLRDTLLFFREIGYSSMLVYDNFGYLFGSYNLAELHSFQSPLLYQLISKLYYFDILLVKPNLAHDFLQSELLYFAESSSSELLKKLASQVQSFS